MSITARDIAGSLLAHINKGADDSLPSGCLTYLATCINRSLDEIRKEAPLLYKHSVGVRWTSSSTGTVGVTHGGKSIALTTLSTPVDGSSILITGDSAYNEIFTDQTTGDTLLLLLPYSGTTGTYSAIAYGDSAVFTDTVDHVLGAHIAENGQPLAILNSRDEWLVQMNDPFRRDYGMITTEPNRARTTGVPRAVWLETVYPPSGLAIAYRAHCAPLPNAEYRAIIEVVGGPVAVSTSEFAAAVGPAVLRVLATPGGRDSILLDLCLYHWSISPWFRNEAARAGIAQRYQAALESLRGFRGDASQPFRMVPAF